MAIDIIARGMIEDSNDNVSQLSEKVYNHTDNSDIHVTATDKSNWNGYATEIEQNKTDISNVKTDIQNLQNQDNVLSSRIDNLSTLPEGSTTADAELADIRVGADGTTYENAGTAVRTQVSELKEDLSYVNVIKEISFSEENIVNGKYISNSGTLSESINMSMTNPINIKKSQKIIFYANGYMTYVSMISKVTNGTYKPLVKSVDSTNREYVYVAEEDSNIVLSFDNTKEHKSKIYFNSKEYIDNMLSEIDSTMKKYGIIRMVDFSIATQGKCVMSYGKIETVDGFAVSSPIELYKGEKISYYATGYQTAISMIASYNGVTYTPIINSIDNTERLYEYTAEKDMTIVLSYRLTTEPNATIFSTNKSYPDYISSELNKKIKTNFSKIGMFPRMAIIGDSLGSGSICDGEYVQDKYGSSWLSFLARKNGATARTHYSNGGICCKSWLTKYLTKMQSDNPFNAYFIALGTNDKYLDQYPLGSITDASGTDSFVGYYKQIVDAVREKAPHAVIFCVSLYTLQGAYVPYSNMIADIANLYDNCFFIDFANNSDIRIDNGSSDYVSDAHFTTLGYQYVASIIDRLVNDVIDENKSFFKFFAKNNSVGEQYED